MRNQSFVVTTTSFSLSLLFCSFNVSFLAELLLKPGGGDFPHGPVVKNPPCNAKDTGFIPGQRTKIPHAVSDAASALKMKTWNGQRQGKIALCWEQCNSEKMVKRCPERSSILVQQGQTLQRELAFHGMLGIRRIS